MTKSFYFKGKLFYLTDTQNLRVLRLCDKRQQPLNYKRVFKIFNPSLSEIYFEESKHSTYRFMVGHDPFFHKYIYVRIKEKERFKDEKEAIKYLKKFFKPTYITPDKNSLIWFMGNQRMPRYVFNNFMEKLQIDYSYTINDYITLKLVKSRTIIYVNNREFLQCKYLLFNLKTDHLEEYDSIRNIDEAKEKLSNDMEGYEGSNYRISPITEFMGHCSNLQAWAENEYNTDILHTNIAFPLLKELTRAGDPLAKKVFNSEIAYRFEHGINSTREFLIYNGYLRHLTEEELTTLYEIVEEKDTHRFSCKIYDIKNKLIAIYFYDILEDAKHYFLKRGRYEGYMDSFAKYCVITDRTDHAQLKITAKGKTSVIIPPPTRVRKRVEN